MQKPEGRSNFDCAIGATMAVIEGRWKPTILCKLMMKGTFRFNQLLKDINGVSPRILAKQLKELENDGLIERRKYPEVPPKVEYSVTAKGRSLGPILIEMSRWGLKNMMTNIVIMDESIKMPTNRSAKSSS